MGQPPGPGNGGVARPGRRSLPHRNRVGVGTPGKFRPPVACRRVPAAALRGVRILARLTTGGSGAARTRWARRLVRRGAAIHAMLRSAAEPLASERIDPRTTRITTPNPNPRRGHPYASRQSTPLGPAPLLTPDLVRGHGALDAADRAARAPDRASGAPDEDERAVVGVPGLHGTDEFGGALPESGRDEPVGLAEQAVDAPVDVPAPCLPGRVRAETQSAPRPGHAPPR